MGDENRDSSGSNTAMIVVAVLVGILLFGCCGGVVILGAGAVFGVGVRSVKVEQEATIIPTAPPPLPPQAIAPVPEPRAVEDKKKE